MVPTSAMLSPGDLRAETDCGHLAHAALACALAQLGEALDQLNVAHAGFDGLGYVVAGDVHAKAGDGVSRLRGVRESVGLVGYAFSRSGAHHGDRGWQGAGKECAFLLAPLQP